VVQEVQALSLDHLIHIQVVEEVVVLLPLDLEGLVEEVLEVPELVTQ
jgi:hypothetical protein